MLKGRRGIKKARTMREVVPDGTLLLDPAEYEDHLYSENALKDLEDEEGWIVLQERLGMDAILTPTPYVPLEASEFLRDYLSVTQELASAKDKPVIVVLPLDFKWLTRGIDELLLRLEFVNLPVGLVLGHRTNPLGSMAAIRGLISLLVRHSNVFMFRTDLSGIGAIAHGALGASIGISSSLRHVVPPGQTGGGNRDDLSPNVLVEALRAYLKGSKLESVQGRAPDILDCLCAVCEGQSLERFGDPLLKPEAQAHSMEVAIRISRRILGMKSDRRGGLWRQICAEGIEAHRELQARVSVRFEPPMDLKAWERAHFFDLVSI